VIVLPTGYVAIIVAPYGIDADVELQPVVPPSLFSGMTKGAGGTPDNAIPAPIVIPVPIVNAMFFPSKIYY
jgi:hypothetical protein